MKQLDLFNMLCKDPPRDGSPTSTFTDNMSLGVHRWFRYSAGFSALWVRELIEKAKSEGRRRVLDPFAGSGTALIEGEYCDVDAIGIESHPFVIRLARSKLLWRVDPRGFREYALDILQEAKSFSGCVEGYPKLIYKCFPLETLSKLDSLRRSWVGRADGSPYSELTWLALASILRECSPAGTAPWQYVLPNKKKSKVVDPITAFEAKVWLMAGDMSQRRSLGIKNEAVLYQEDARRSPSIPDAWAECVITSPPYANNFDYADATRLEMSFFGEVDGWADLQDSVRVHLIRSCTQHVAKLNGQTYEMLEHPFLEPIRPELLSVCRLLETEREAHGGKKPYHTMLVAYFSDMAGAWRELRRVSAQGAAVCFVIGDSAPYGIHAPVERWLGELALAAGFKSFRFEKIRSRNTKWKNRKHSVPLHEGYLWIQG